MAPCGRCAGRRLGGQNTDLPGRIQPPRTRLGSALMPHRATPWWNSTVHADRRAGLRLRGQVTAAVRGWFADEGFTEVETAQLQISPGNETHLHALRTDWRGIADQPRPRYLRTSPEFAAKKLLAAGETRIFEFARVFRDREIGPLHLPEFTMLEWYRAGAAYDDVIADTLAIIALAAQVTGQGTFRWRDRSADPARPAERLSVADAFSRYAQIDLLESVNDATGNRAHLAAQAAAAGIRVAEDDDWSDIFSKVLVERIEPQLGNGAATVLYEYPAPEAALARRCAHDPRVCERFEVYMCGVELANGYGELTDPAEQRRRFNSAMDRKERIYGERYPLDEDFLAALAQMPPAAGVALGFDRLVMLATGATRIDQVVWTPPEGLDA